MKDCGSYAECHGHANPPRKGGFEGRCWSCGQRGHRERDCEKAEVGVVTTETLAETQEILGVETKSVEEAERISTVHGDEIVDDPRWVLTVEVDDEPLSQRASEESERKLEQGLRRQRRRRGRRGARRGRRSCRLGQLCSKLVVEVETLPGNFVVELLEKAMRCRGGPATTGAGSSATSLARTSRCRACACRV